MSRPFILFLWCRPIAAEVRGGGKVKHRKLLGESGLIGLNSFSMRGPSETESGRNPVKLSRLWSLFLMCAEAAHIQPMPGSATAQSKYFQISFTVFIHFVMHSNIMKVSKT